MKLPIRGDHNSLVVVAVIFLCEAFFWIVAVWFPIVALAMFIHTAWNDGVTFLDGIMLTYTLIVLACAAVICRLLSRGLITGKRIAYIAMAVVFVVRALLKIASAAGETAYLRPKHLGLAVTFVAIAVLLGLIARRGETSAEPAA